MYDPALKPGTQAQPDEIAEVAARQGVIRLPNSRHVDISASEIRRRVAEGRSIQYLVPTAVASYIAKNNLYRGNAQAPSP